MPKTAKSFLTHDKEAGVYEVRFEFDKEHDPLLGSFTSSSSETFRTWARANAFLLERTEALGLAGTTVRQQWVFYPDVDFFPSHLQEPEVREWKDVLAGRGFPQPFAATPHVRLTNRINLVWCDGDRDWLLSMMVAGPQIPDEAVYPLA